MRKMPAIRPLLGRCQRGAGMIEVMVSCLVLSAGLVAISAMQSNAIANSGDVVLQADQTQVLLSFGEALLVNTNAVQSNGAACDGTVAVGVDTRATDTAFFTEWMKARCSVDQAVIESYPDGASYSNCNGPARSSRNVYCSFKSLNLAPQNGNAIDLRQPVWTH